MRVFLILLLAADCCAQTLTTNWVQAAPNFREVGGKLYNIEKSTNFVVIEGDFEQKVEGGSLMNCYTLRSTGHMTGGDGSFGSGHYVHGQIVRENEHEIFIRNVEGSPTTGSKIKVKAMRVGNVDIDSKTLEAWDCGKPHVVPVIKPNSPPK